MKVSRTTSMDVIAECRYWFGLYTGNGDADFQAQADVYGQIRSVRQRIILLCQLFAHVENV